MYLLDEYKELYKMHETYLKIIACNINLKSLYTKLKKLRKLRRHDPETDALTLSAANAR